ncbi:MAG: type II toxin-antitoxin system RelE/ParE family toxin [Deltaproteobacteria bacterium]|nr:type II toxin-antitoxin system RelE/ParE family toxin [Deltaproteobacteria bacterium]
MKIKLKASAEKDLLEIYSWYESQRLGLGKSFLIAFEAKLNLIARNPFLFQKFYKNVYRVFLDRFPYQIFYSSQDNLLTVLGVFHFKRSEAYWKQRVK